MLPTLAQSILVATDLGSSSDEVVRTAAKVAALAGAELHLLHVVEELPALPRAPEIGVPTFFDRFEVAERALEDQILRTVPADVTIGSRRVIMYAVHRAIAEHALAVSADLVVLGACRSRTGFDSIRSTTADRVIQTVEVPCLVARRTLSVPLRRVVVPVDPEEPTFGAVEWGLGWCGALGAREDGGAALTVLHMLPRQPDGGSVPFDGVFEPTEAVPGVSINQERLWGERPAQEIVRFAEREGADLLVIAAQGHGVLQRMFFGSTSCALAREAPCPVLLLPPKLWLSTLAGPLSIWGSAPETSRNTTPVLF